MLTVKASAKINWFLDVLGKRSDGYHEIRSLMQKVTLHDILTFEPSRDLVVKTDAAIPEELNLVCRAAALLKTTYRVQKGALIHLEKNIPLGAGLGGGSSDAAAALRGLNEIWSLGLSTGELFSIAERIGSDVPFFLDGSLSFVQGRGERLTPCRAEKPFDLLLVKPPIDVSTAWVYRNFPILTKKAGKVNNIKLLIRNIERAELSGLTGEVSNDLESVTISSFPVIAAIKESMRKLGSLFSLMSGSGSTVFGVFATRRLAEEASRVFEGYWTAVVETITD